MQKYECRQLHCQVLPLVSIYLHAYNMQLPTAVSFSASFQCSS
uniref:Uncharacterized protein n=1 Tax=Arundo donax TaxID=35708 RepID=A0A0A9CBG0_ARUDO